MARRRRATGCTLKKKSLEDIMEYMKTELNFAPR
jgi:hypothetical protein